MTSVYKGAYEGYAVVEATVGKKYHPDLKATLLTVHIELEAVRAGSIEKEVKEKGTSHEIVIPLRVVLGCVTVLDRVDGTIKSTPDKELYCATGGVTAGINGGESSGETGSVTETGRDVEDTVSITYVYLISYELAGSVVEAPEGSTIDSLNLKVKKKQPPARWNTW